MTKLVFLFLFFFFPLFYLVRKDFIFETVIQYGNHTEVFHFLSNVSKFQLLNPTIMSINHWEKTDERNFYVRYTECLSQVPALWNYSHGFYRIVRDGDAYSLVSHHFTCFFSDFLCLSTNSVLRITKESKTEVGYREEISYSCPWVLTRFCFNEVAFQRNLITTKLKEIFSTAGKYKNLN